MILSLFSRYDKASGLEPHSTRRSSPFAISSWPFSGPIEIEGSVDCRRQAPLGLSLAIVAPRIHEELSKLGFVRSEVTFAKYMARPRKPPSQTWRTFLANHRKDIVSSDFFLLPTVFFRVLFAFVILSHDRRRRPFC